MKPLAHLSLFASLLTFADPTPAQTPPTRPERIVIRAVLAAGEQGYLLVSPARTPEYRVPGTTLDLAIDARTASLLPLDTTDQRGGRELTFSVPAEIDLSRTPVYAQVVGLTPGGLRALPVFRLASGDRAVTPVSKPATIVAEGLEGTESEAGATSLHRAIQISRNPALGITMFTVDGRPLGRRQQGDVAGRTPAGVGPVELMSPAMSGLSLVADPSVYPSCVHGQIIIDWPNGARGQGSGTLIDAKHVITAGHVVFQSDKGGWATNLTFVPAYDDGSEPYGKAISASGLGWRHAWTDWTEKGNDTHDIAYFQVDRPVGALTSWHGYGFSTDCDFYKTTIFYTRSYPGETPYTGELMYQRSGTFDSCPNEREARFNLYSYKGESGAGYYYINDNGSRYVRAVGSHRNTNPDSADRVRLTESKFDNVVDTIASAKSTTFDFTPLAVTVGSTPRPHVARGAALPDLDFVAHNYSTASFTGTLSWTVRLSTDKTIAASDTLLRTTSATFTVDANGSKSINHGNPPTIPTTIAPGPYFVGIILTTADGNGANQVTLTEDVAKIIVD